MKYLTTYVLIFQSVFLTFLADSWLYMFIPVDTVCTHLYDEQVPLDSLYVMGGEWKAASWNPTARTIRLINTPVNNNHSALFK